MLLLGLKSEHEVQFELAIKEDNLPFAYELAIDNPTEDKWRKLCKLSRKNKNMNFGQNCFLHAIGYITGKYLLKVHYSQLPNKQIGQNKRVGWVF